MVLAKHSVPGRPTKLINSGGPEGLSALGVGAGGLEFSLLSPYLWKSYYWLGPNRD